MSDLGAVAVVLVFFAGSAGLVLLGARARRP
jgi:hypothetical protein